MKKLTKHQRKRLRFLEERANEILRVAGTDSVEFILNLYVAIAAYDPKSKTLDKIEEWLMS